MSFILIISFSSLSSSLSLGFTSLRPSFSFFYFVLVFSSFRLLLSFLLLHILFLLVFDIRNNFISFFFAFSFRLLLSSKNSLAVIKVPLLLLPHCRWSYCTKIKGAMLKPPFRQYDPFVCKSLNHLFITVPSDRRALNINRNPRRQSKSKLIF